jgi:hypothetical protein
MSRELEIRYRLARIARLRRDEWERRVFRARLGMAAISGVLGPYPVPPKRMWWADLSIESEAVVLGRMIREITDTTFVPFTRVRWTRRSA